MCWRSALQRFLGGILPARSNLGMEGAGKGFAGVGMDLLGWAEMDANVVP